MAKYKFHINPKYSHLSDFIHQLPSVFDHEGTIIHDKRNKVRTFEVNGMTLVVKRYKKPMLHQRIDYTLVRPSKALRAYTFALRLDELAIATPEAIACIEKYCGGLFCQGYFVSAFNGDKNLRILQEEDNKELTRALAAFIIDCHSKGFMHGDTNLSNYLYHKDSSAPYGYFISTIDINRSHFKANPSKKECIANLTRMTHNHDTLLRIVEEYAIQRGWDANECKQTASKMLSAFERRKNFFSILKGKGKKYK